MTSKPKIVFSMLLAMTSASGCRQDMHDQPRTKPARPTAAFADGSSARLPPSGTVARDQIVGNEPLTTGTKEGQFVTTYPVAVTKALLDRGQSRYHIYCEPCHGLLGHGDGVIASRGFFPKPVADLQQIRLRYVAVGYLFGVITGGFGIMPAYGNVLAPADRWATIAYLRALQLSQHAEDGGGDDGGR
jgi:mono/diheme cytochrome c family protein